MLKRRPTTRTFNPLARITKKVSTHTQNIRRQPHVMHTDVSGSALNKPTSERTTNRGLERILLSRPIRVTENCAKSSDRSSGGVDIRIGTPRHQHDNLTNTVVRLQHFSAWVACEPRHTTSLNGVVRGKVTAACGRNKNEKRYEYNNKLARDTGQ